MGPGEEDILNANLDKGIPRCPGTDCTMALGFWASVLLHPSFSFCFIHRLNFLLVQVTTHFWGTWVSLLHLTIRKWTWPGPADKGSDSWLLLFLVLLCRVPSPTASPCAHLSPARSPWADWSSAVNGSGICLACNSLWLEGEMGL